LVQVIQPLHLFYVTTLTTQVSRVSMGPEFDTEPRFGWQLVFFVSGLPTLSCATG
jgi:hypothetical protein